MHTFCEVGQLNWIGPLSVDNPGVAVRQWQSRPSSRCYFNGPLLHSAYTPFKVLFFVKNIGQWHAKSGPKAAHGNFAMRKKKSGSLKKKWERTGRNASHFAHTHTHSAKLVVRIYIYIYTIIGRSLVNICKGLEPRKCRSMNARSRPFFAKSRSLNDNMGQLCIALGTLNIYQCSPRKPNNFIQTGQWLYKYHAHFTSHAAA